MGYKRKQAFTLVELLVVVALMTLFLFMTVPFTMEFYREQVLEGQTSSLASNLKVAQSHARSGKNDSSWGIKFLEDNYILFMGGSYDEVGRDDTYDKTFKITSGVEIEGVSEIVFEKDTGKLFVIL